MLKGKVPGSHQLIKAERRARDGLGRELGRINLPLNVVPRGREGRGHGLGLTAYSTGFWFCLLVIWHRHYHGKLRVMEHGGSSFDSAHAILVAVEEIAVLGQKHFFLSLELDSRGGGGDSKESD